MLRIRGFPCKFDNHLTQTDPHIRLNSPTERCVLDRGQNVYPMSCISHSGTSTLVDFSVSPHHTPPGEMNDFIDVYSLHRLLVSMANRALGLLLQLLPRRHLHRPPQNQRLLLPHRTKLPPPFRPFSRSCR